MKHFAKTLSVLLIILLATIASVSVVSAGSGTALPSPVIYGDFNSNVIEGAGSCALTETGTGTGIFKGTFTFTAYAGAGDGYSLFTCISKVLDGGSWVPAEYYTMAGVAGTPSSTSYFKPTVTGKYEVVYTASTHVTTATLVEYNLPSPVIYGVFNNWAIEGADAKPLTETGTGTGIFKATYSFDAYTGTGDGYDMTTCISKKYYADWSSWGAGEQYKMDGTAAGMGTTSSFKPTITGKYEVVYTASTHVTTITLVGYNLPTPVIYGVFNGWALEGADAKPLTETGTGTGIFQAIYSFNAYTGTGDGYDMTTCISKKYYADWSSWGANEQYKMDGTAAGMGTTSYFKPTATGNYLVTYTASTHVTTIYQVVALPQPVIYGDFNGWAIEGANARPLTETGTGTGIYKGTYSFTAYTGTGDGYYMITSLSKKDSEWGFGSYEQYKMNGDPAGFGATSFFKPTVTGNYLVTYNSTTHVTTLTLVTNPQTSDSNSDIYAIGMLAAAAIALGAALIARKKERA